MATHQRDGERPERNITIRIPTPLYTRVLELARAEERTFSGEVRLMMQRRVAEADSEAALKEAA